MRERTATAIVSEYRAPAARPKEAAGPCPVEHCGGQLEVRHDRMYGKVYTVCPTCERRVLEVRQLRDNLARLRAELTNTQARLAESEVARHAATDAMPPS